MGWFKRVLGLFALLALAALTLTFVLENQSVSQLSLFGYATAQYPVALWVLAFFVCGAVLGLLLGMLIYYRLKLQLRRMHAALKRTQSSCSKLEAQLQEKAAETASAQQPVSA